jgi:hypothetical protein
VLRLHPPGFRKRFAGEMLSIFDHTAGRLASSKLLLDCLLSLARQWALRPEFWHEVSPTPQLAPDGIPSFSTLDRFRPRASAVVHGLVLSTAVFCLTCFAIRYSWIHILHVRIPEVQFESPRSKQMNATPLADTMIEKPAVPPRAQDTTPMAPSAALHHSLRVRSDQPAPIRTQKRSAQRSETPKSEMLVSKTRGTKSQKRSMTSPEAPSATPMPQARLQRGAGSDLDQPQALPANPQFAASAETRAEAEDMRLDAAERQRVIHGAAANLTKYYVDPGVAQKMARALLVHEQNGDDDTATDGNAFADLLTRQMLDVSHDSYVTMVYSTVTTPENPPAPTAKEVALYRKEMLESNCTFENVRILPHNIAYVKFNEFPDASICGTTVAAAMASLNHADAIIFDLRDNRGGYSNMVALIATYLFDRPTHLNDFYDRGDNSTEQSWTQPPVPGNRLADKPAYVLTSPTTFSAAEGFSYDLKMLKRATLVGETTSGRGHMGMGHRIDDHFTIRVPGMRVINPISKTNWEGTGVEPDVKVKAADALATAEKLAERKLQQQK